MDLYTLYALYVVCTAGSCPYNPDYNKPVAFYQSRYECETDKNDYVRERRRIARSTEWEAYCRPR